ncbi:hypothetical protein I4U23_024478 [Adineta vaga]|nr:hypothetical protein I4U23_024478 [Adineta vaga]
MASSSSQFSNNGKSQILPTSTTLLFTQPMNNNVTINNIAMTAQNIRQSNTPNGTYFQQQQPMSTGTISTSTGIVRLNQSLSTSNQFISPTVWTNNGTQLSPKLQYSPTMKSETITPGISQQTSILPTKLVAQPVVRQTVTAPQAPKFTEAQINDFVGKCRTFLTTLLKLAEKQAPEKLPMVRSCIQDLLDGTIDPESFTQRLHTLYKSQPHTSLVPFFKLALPYMRQMVKNTYGQSITIELLEKLNLPSNKTTTTTTITTPTTATTSRVVVNPSLLTQQSNSGIQQPILYTTVQPQQKINLLQQNPPQTIIGTTPSLLGQQQQQQQQARTQISITGIRPLLTTVSPSSNTNLLTGQQQIQPIIPQSDSLLQRTFLSSSTTLQQPQIITVNHQSIKTEIGTGQKTLLTNISSLQQQSQPRPILKNEDDSSDDVLGNNGLLTTTAAPVDDRHTRHITHEARLVSSLVLRRRLDQLVKKDKRSETGPMTFHDDAVLALISHATEERLKCLIEQIKSIAQNRASLSIQMEHDEDEPMSTPSQGNKRKLEENINQHAQISSTQSKLINHLRKSRFARMLSKMLNAIPDTRNPEEMSEVFLAPKDEIDNERKDEIATEDKISIHETIDLNSRRPSSFSTIEHTKSNGMDSDTIHSHRPWIRLLAECIAELFGTTILVLFGCSGIAQFTLSRGKLSSFLSVNFAFGFGALIAVYVAGPISGAHLNPAVSIAMLSLRSITPLQCLAYTISQFIGAFIAAALVFGTYYSAIAQFDGGVRQVTGEQATAGIFGTLPAQGVGQVSLFFDQVLSTALLLIAVCALSNKRNKLVANAQIPLAVGFVIVAIGVAFGYNCGFPINPARDLGPRLFTLCVGYGSEVFSVGNYYFWIPCVGPVFGALIGAWIYHGYGKLMKIHIGEDEQEIARARYQVDVQNVTRM